MIRFREKGACREEIAVHRAADRLPLEQQNLGTPVDEICRKMGIAQATFFVWKKKYSGLGPPELRRLKRLEEENAKLKKLVADLSLRQGDAAGRGPPKNLKPARMRELVDDLQMRYGASQSRACAVMMLSRSV